MIWESRSRQPTLRRRWPKPATPFTTEISTATAYYLAADTKSKKLYDFRRFVLVEGIDHPLNTPDPCAAFNALPAEDQAAMLEWIKTSLVPIRRARLVSELRFPCQVVSGLAITNEHMRGAIDGGNRDSRTPLPLLPE